MAAIANGCKDRHPSSPACTLRASSSWPQRPPTVLNGHQSKLATRHRNRVSAGEPSFMQVCGVVRGGYDASKWPHSDGLKWPHLKSDTLDVGLKWSHPRGHAGWRPGAPLSSTAARPPATSRRSRWSARSEARTYDLDLRGASATMGLRGRPGWVQFKPSPDPWVEPNEAVMVGPNEAVIATGAGSNRRASAFQAGSRPRPDHPKDSA
jgi:hypothetical protein